MPQSSILVDGKLYALEVDGDKFSASIYNGNGKPEWREVSEDCHRALKVKFGDFLAHLEAVGGYEYRSYNLNAQIEQDWGAELTEQIAVRETEQSFLAGTR